MSQFDITKNIDNNNKIIYDYNNAEINNSDITYKNNYLNINVSYPINVPNVSYPDNFNTYNATNIYISSVIHNNIVQIQSNYIIGELIIEHSSITGTGKLYTCFYLESDPSNKINDKNDIDNLLDAYNKDNKTVSLVLNRTIPSQDYAIVYKDKVNNVVIFTQPIVLNYDSYNYITKKIVNSNLKLFPIYNSSYNVLQKANISQRGEEEIYIDCSPTGESAQTIASYNVPINSEYTRDWGKLDFMKLTIQLLMVFIFILLAYFGVPIMYKTVVVDNIRILLYDDEPSDKYIRNVVIDNLLLFISGIIFIYTLLYGITVSNYDYVMYAVYFFIFAGLALSIILYNKSSIYFNDTYIVKGMEAYEDDTFSFFTNMSEDFLYFLKDTLIFIGFTFFNFKDKTQIGKNWGILIGFVLLFLIPLIILRWGARVINHTTFTFLTYISTFCISMPGSVIYLLCMYRLGKENEMKKKTP